MNISAPNSPWVSYDFVVRRACPACGGTAARTLFECGFRDEPIGSFLRSYYRRDIPEGSYRLDRCTRCGTVFQAWQGNDEFLKALYSEWLTEAPADVPSYALELSQFRQSRDGHELMALAAFLKRPRLKVLDYGTGWGLWPAIAAELGHQAYATELAENKARWVAGNGVKILSNDEVSTHTFDVINLEQTLEHVSEPRALLEALIPSLAGVLKIAVPNAARVDRIVRELQRGDCSGIGPVHPFEHINGFDAHSLDYLARSLGLKEVRPSLAQRFAFVPSGVPRSPKRLAKEIARPFWAFNSSTNLYRWFVRH